MTLLTRENLIQLITTSVWLEFIFYTINFKINQSSYLIQIVYLIIVLHEPTMLFALLKNQFFGKFAFEMTPLLFFWGGGGGGGGEGGEGR